MIRNVVLFFLIKFNDKYLLALLLTNRTSIAIYFQVLLNAFPAKSSMITRSDQYLVRFGVAKNTFLVINFWNLFRVLVLFPIFFKEGSGDLFHIKVHFLAECSDIKLFLRIKNTFPHIPSKKQFND